MAPPPASISGYDPRFFRTCTFPMLNRLNYGTRVTINNGVAEGPFATPLALSMSAWDNDGRLLGTTPVLRELAPGEIVKLEVEDGLGDIGASLDDDLLGMFHLVPARHVGAETIEVAPNELMAHMGASDDFVEFHQKPKGVITGVAYQTGPLNDARFGTTRTTVVQAPKVIVTDTVDTLFCLMNLAPRFDYEGAVEMDFWILGPGGERICRSWIRVPAFTFRLVSMREVLETAGALDDLLAVGGKGMFFGLSQNGTAVPLSLTRNQESGAIACDHTLPPIFYLTTWGGDARLAQVEKLKAEFFAGPRSPEPVGPYNAIPAAA